MSEPRPAILEFATDLILILRMRGLLLPMVVREMSARTAGTALGMLWLYMPPLMLLAAYYYLFEVIFSMRLGEGAVVDRLGIYLVVGIIPWFAFADGLNRAANSLVDAAELLKKNPLPVMLFPVRSVLASMAIFAPLFVLVVPFAMLTQGPAWSMVWVLPLWLGLSLLVLLLGLLLALFTAASRDTSQVLGLILSIGFFLAPIIYPMSMAPWPFQLVMWLNPATPFVLSFQTVLLGAAMPPQAALLAIGLWLVVLALLVSLVLRRCREQVVDWL